MQRARKRERGFSFFIRQINIARTHGEAVGLANDGTGDDFDGKILVADHFSDDGDLGGVFLSEEGDAGLNEMEEFGNDGGDAAEVAGAGFAIEAVAEAFNGDEC